MKTKIEIEFDDVHERGLAVSYLCAEQYTRLIADFLNHIRSALKYEENIEDCCAKRLEGLREFVYDGLAEIGKGPL